MQTLVTLIARHLNEEGINFKVTYIFDRQEEFSGRAKSLYDGVLNLNPYLAARMGSLTYADKREFEPLQVADNLAYECMKLMLNKLYDPTRPERISIKRMKGKIANIGLCDREQFQSMTIEEQ